MTVSVAEVMAAMEARFPARLAEDWDRVGLVVGDRTRPVGHALLTVDVTAAVIDEAARLGAELIIAHHPLLLRGVHAVVNDQPKGRLIISALSAGVAIFTAHTNGDQPPGGVSDALARALGLTDARPLQPVAGEPDTGLGRVGTLATPMSASTFAERVARTLPATATGVRLAGDPERLVSTVALLGGAGDSMLEAARHSGADLYLTSDLRHHPASEALEHRDAPVLIDVAHWAAEWTWLPVLADYLGEALPPLRTTVSRLCTDPWALRLP